MPLKNRRSRIALTALALFLAATILGAAGWWVSGSPGDLSLLEPHAKRHAFTKLEALLRETEGSPDTFSFVVLGDTRSNTIIAPQVYEHAARENPVLMVNTGDLIRGGTVSEYLELHIPWCDSVYPIPVFCVPGNHERDGRRSFAAFEKLYGATQFSFDYGACRFVGFNASETIRISSADLEFLEEELSKPGATYKFVFFHIPPKYFERLIAGDDRRGIAWNADKLHALMVKHDVNEVFMAHIHGYASEVMDGVRYTLTAGGGAPFSERLPQEAHMFHYMLIHVSPEGLHQELVYMEYGTTDWCRRDIY